VRKGQAKNPETGEAINPMMNPQSGQTFKKPFRERDATTERPKAAQPCPFRIVIQWEPSKDDSNAGRWYICGGNMTHEGHLQKEGNEIQVLSNHHDEENKRLALSAMQVHLGGGYATQALVNNHHQAFFMPSQLQNLKRTGIRTGPCPQPALIDPNLTAADRLINFFTNQSDLSFTALYAKVEIAEGLLTIKKKSNNSNKKQKKRHSKVLRCRQCILLEVLRLSA
jgi:hypothetical protein